VNNVAEVNALTAGPKSGGKETVEIRGIYLETEKAPHTGQAVYIVVEQHGKKFFLLCPWTLQEFEISTEEFRRGAKESYWPENTSGVKFDVQKLVNRIKLNVQAFALKKRTFPTTTVIKVITELGGMTTAEVEALIKSALPEDGRSTTRQNKLGKQFRLAKGINLAEYRGRQKVVLEAFKEVGIASIHVIVDKVQGKLKSKLDHERVVTYFVNQYHSKGILELVGEQMRLPK
jgi:hypothetical protein